MGKVKAFLVVALVVVFLTPAAVVVADEAERELGLEKKHRKAEEERVADAQPGGGSGGPAPGGGAGKGWPAQGRGGGGGGGGWPTPGGGGGGGGGDGWPTPGGGGGGGRGWPTPGGGGGGGEWPTPSGGGGGGGGGEGRPTFILQDVRQVMSSPAGELKVARGQSWRFRERPLHIGFISMEPKSLFIPQYWDSDLIIFVHRGEARIGLIYKDDLVEKRLKKGDLYRISTGSTFYILNRAEGQRLYIICGIDSSMGLGLDTFQSFFVGGGINAPSVLAGFDPITLSTALNVSLEDIREVLTGNKLGPFVFVNTTHDTHDELSKWAKITASMTGSWDMDEDEDEDREDEHSSEWSWRKMLLSFLPSKKNKRGDDKGDDKGPDPFNIYDDKDPDFQNDYGSSLIVNKNDYKPLKKSKVSVFHVNLSAGSMMAPHLNPRAAEYTIVLRGKGSVEVVYPNGTLAMNAMVKEGDVFWIPQFFPFCQIASRSGPFEFFGFSTSSRRNRPQFLAGSSSILRTLLGPELAASYGMSEDRFRRFVGAQPRSVIFPPKNTSVPVGPPVGPPLPPRPKEKTRVESEGRLQTTIRSRMAMVFE